MKVEPLLSYLQHMIMKDNELRTILAAKEDNRTIRQNTVSH
jgi:hypothetical protein